MSNRSWLTTIRAIAWDLDGTLYPNNPAMHQKVIELRNNRIAEKLTIDPMLAEFEFHKIRDAIGSNTKALEMIGIDGKEFFSQMWNDMDLSLYIFPEPKVQALFDCLKNYHHLLISNSNSQKNIQRKLDLIGVDMGVFDVVVDTVALGAFKPDSLPYTEALDRLNKSVADAITMDQCVYVGDRVETDIKGAKNVGMYSCLVGSTDPLADICVESIYELEGILLSS